MLCFPQEGEGVWFTSAGMYGNSVTLWSPERDRITFWTLPFPQNVFAVSAAFQSKQFRSCAKTSQNYCPISSVVGDSDYQCFLSLSTSRSITAIVTGAWWHTTKYNPAPSPPPPHIAAFDDSVVFSKHKVLHQPEFVFCLCPNISSILTKLSFPLWIF